MKEIGAFHAGVSESERFLTLTVARDYDGVRQFVRVTVRNDGPDAVEFVDDVADCINGLAVVRAADRLVVIERVNPSIWPRVCYYLVLLNLFALAAGSWR